MASVCRRGLNIHQNRMYSEINMELYTLFMLVPRPFMKHNRMIDLYVTHVCHMSQLYVRIVYFYSLIGMKCLHTYCIND